MKTKGELVIAADLDWYDLWKIRMDNPLDDAETFKFQADGKVIELGKKPNSLKDVEAQYIGLIKVDSHKVSDFIGHYLSLDKNATYDGKDFNNMYMTSFIQSLIDHGWDTRAALINNGWIEVDSVDDLEAYQSLDRLPGF